MRPAIGVYAIALARCSPGGVDPWFDFAFDVPKRRDVDSRLVVGAAIFGVGWGSRGYVRTQPSALSSTSVTFFVVRC